MQLQHKLTPFIWYQSGAEDAVAHYLRVFGAGQGRAAYTADAAADPAPPPPPVGSGPYFFTSARNRFRSRPAYFSAMAATSRGDLFALYRA